MPMHLNATLIVVFGFVKISYL